MARNNQRGTKNNNPEGRNQFSNGFIDGARDRPVATAAAAAAAVGAGVFLWSRRNQISDQISNLSDQFSEFGQQFGGTRSNGNRDDFEFTDAGTTGSSASTAGKSGKRGKSGGQGFAATTGSTGGTAGAAGGGTDF